MKVQGVNVVVNRDPLYGTDRKVFIVAGFGPVTAKMAAKALFLQAASDIANRPL